MTRDECKMILRIVCASYPNFNSKNIADTLDAWYFMLSDYDYNRIAVSLKAYISTSGSAFAPSISELIALAYKPAEMTTLNEAQAWDLVYKAICNSNYNSEDEFNNLPDLVQKAVGSPSQLRAWASDCDFNSGVESSNFKRVYKTVVERDKELQRMPAEMRQMIGGMYDKTGIEEKA